MKKKFKKLSLSTETLRHLSEPSLKDVAGGATIAATDCSAPCSLCTRPCTECITCRPCVP